MQELKKDIYIDALALVPERKSGVGNTLEETLQSLLNRQELKDYSFYLVVPLGKAKQVKKYLRQNVQIKTLFLPARLIEGMQRLRILPPVDWFLGKGVYVFPNYRNWPLWKSRSLTYVYDLSFILHPQTVQVKNQKYLQKFIKLWTGRADQIITISEQVSGEIEKYIGAAYTKIHVVYCGVNTSFFAKRGATDIERVKNKHKIPFNNYLLFVGNIEPRKNLGALVNVYENLPKTIRQKFGLVIVGSDGWHNEAINKKIKKAQQSGLHILKIEGYVAKDDLPALYSGASLHVHPAIYEGFGMTPLEAMACGTPVAVSDIPAIKEVVREAGYYFNPHDAISMKQAIIEALTEEASRQAKIAKGLEISKELTWGHTATELAKIIEEERAQGPHGHPLLSRMRSVYVRFDRLIRSLLGDKERKAYRPNKADSLGELQKNIYDDFMLEQPSHAQVMLLKVYLATKHAAAYIAKKAYLLARRAY